MLCVAASYSPMLFARTNCRPFGNLVTSSTSWAGAVPGFKYSEAMLASGVVWDAQAIADYTRQPKEFIPGNKMVFAGLKKDDEVEDLIAFIESKCCS